MINSDSAELPEIASKTYSNELIDSAREKATARLLSSNSSSKTRMQRGGGVKKLQPLSNQPSAAGEFIMDDASSG